MSSIVLDLRQAARGLRRAPGSAVTAVIALGLGIGLSTLMFSIIYGALLRGLPVEEAHELFAVERYHRARAQTMGSNEHDFTVWREGQRTFEDLGAYWAGTVNLSGAAADETPERASGAWVTPAVLRMLGVQPVLGRTLLEEDDVPGAQPVMVLGYELWQRRFDGSADAIGRTVRANGVETVVVGVMPEGFGFPNNQVLWQAARLDPGATVRGEGRFVQVMGRLRDGVTADEATLDLDRIATQIAAEFPETNEGLGIAIEPFTDTAIGDEPRTVLLTMFGAVVFVLLIACVNVANLLIGRAIMRSREVGIRTSLGASRASVAMPFLAESLILAISGALLGLAIAFIGLRLFTNAVADSQPPYWLIFRIDGVALAFVASVTIVAAVLAGVIPALQAARAPIGEVLKDESRGASSFRLGRLSRVLVVVEMALSVGLLAGAGLMIKSVIRLNAIDLGFPTEQVFTARIGLPENGYTEPGQQRLFMENLLARLQTLNAAQPVVLANGLPGLGGGGAGFTIEGAATEPGEEPQSALATITPGYFDLFDVAIRDGRDFASNDRDGSTPVAIVNQPFVDRWFEGGDALGRRIRFGGAGSDAPWMTIVGVVPDLRAGGLSPDSRREAIYVPLAQNPARFITVAARATGDPLALTADVRGIVSGLDRDIPLYFVQTLATGIARQNWFYGVFGTLFAVFGFAALFLAGVGLYGVMSFSVGQRTRELGVRMAIGARPGDVVRMVLGQGMRQVLIGMAFGTAFALAVSRLLAAILFDVSPRDPWVFTTIVLVLSAAAAFACGLPAARATRVDPLQALRSE